VGPEVNPDPLVRHTKAEHGVDWPELADGDLSGDRMSTMCSPRRCTLARLGCRPGWGSEQGRWRAWWLGGRLVRAGHAGAVKGSA
jgi:hypothetical protein